MKFSIHLAEERKLKVYEELSQGSDPRTSFFVLVFVSTLIAAFGLVMNSTAVVIGAMLVAPLMTPILGLALALVRGDTRLLATASRSEALGVIISILAAALLGLALPPHFEATPEMLSRTNPNLLDLIVAVLAGLAGAYALVDEKISPVLPGVAIATAIVPPLANCGMSIALGAFDGALGSFLLFFTNFLSILLISSLVFYLAGMGEELHSRTGVTLARRFGVAVTGFLVVAVLLSSELFEMFEDRRLRSEIMQTLEQESADVRASEMSNLFYQRKDDKLLVLVEANAPTVIRPRTVEAIQSKLARRLGQPVELFVRTTVTHDVSGKGSINQAVAETLDGFFVARKPDQRILILQRAEQSIREYLDDRRGIHLEGLEVLPDTGLGWLLIAETSGLRALAAQEIAEMEELIQHRVTEATVKLLLQQETSTLRDALGGMRTEFSLPRPITEQERELIERIGSFAHSWLSDKTYWLHSWSVTILDGVYHLLLEVTGPSLFNLEDQGDIKRDLASTLNLPIEVYVRSQLEAVVGPQGNTSFEELLSDFRRRNRAEYGDEIRRTIIEAR